MSVFLHQALLLLETAEEERPEIKEAHKLLQEITVTKTAGLGDLIHDPKFQNIVNLLTPFIMNYKVNQVLKLLEEIAKEQKKYDPQTGHRRYF